MKDLLKKINRITIILTSIAFILGMLLHLWSLMIIICILVSLFIFGLYIYLYPKAYFIEPKNKEDYHLPWIGVVASLIILVVYTSTCNFDTTTYFLSSIPITLILLIVYIIKLIQIRSINAKRFIFVFMAIIAMSLCITVPFNTLFPTISTTREKVEILSKSYANQEDYEKTFALYLKVGNSTKRFNVSKKKYKSVKEDDYVLIEKKTNLFGMIFYDIY